MNENEFQTDYLKVIHKQGIRTGIQFAINEIFSGLKNLNDFECLCDTACDNLIKKFESKENDKK